MADMLRRSVLFSPGDDPAKLRKAPTFDADVAVFDLEDAVVPDRKAAARETVRDALAAVAPADCELCVRVNPVGQGAAEDVAVALGDTAPDAVMLPKTGGADDVDRLAALLDEAGIDRPILAIVESAAGILNAEAVAAHEVTDALVFGAEDLAGDIGATRTPDGEEVAHARQHVVLAARAAGVSPIDTHFPNYTDDAGLRAETERAVQLGYDGKLAIHPAQATVINEVFAPSPERVAWADRILAARETADSGVFVVDGEMIDAPQIRQAERVRERAGADRE
jgi:citrate lyase subunit beta/citryl-CoA lyase